MDEGYSLEGLDAAHLLMESEGLIGIQPFGRRESDAVYDDPVGSFSSSVTHGEGWD